jgi:hypothetical protein
MVYFDPFTGKVTEKITDDTWFYTMIEDDEDPNVIWAVGWEQSLNRFNLVTRERKVYRHNPQDPNTSPSITPLPARITIAISSKVLIGIGYRPANSARGATPACEAELIPCRSTAPTTTASGTFPIKGCG